MNTIEEQILQAVAQDQVTRKVVLLARRYLADRDRKREALVLRTRREETQHAAPAKAPVPSVAHHDQFRAAAEAEREATSDLTWEACLQRSRADYWGAYACELGQHAVARDLLEPHHLQYGSGHRTEEERPENVMAVCREHHDEFHARPIRWVERVKAWCDERGFPYPSRKEYR